MAPAFARLDRAAANTKVVSLQEEKALLFMQSGPKDFADLGTLPQPTTSSQEAGRDFLDTKKVATKVSISSLSFQYAGFQALHSISLPLYRNRITALIGHSGSGKSTLLRTVNRLCEISPDTCMDGEILLDGEDIRHIDVTALRRRVGMVFQQWNPFPKSVFENVAYGLRLQGHSKFSPAKRAALCDAVERSLRRAALWEEVKDKLSEPAHHLSGGQQQRLCIARALAVNPEVLLLDEPCSALDPTATAKIEDLLRELKHSCTILIATHNLEQARRIADYTGSLRFGRLVEFGRTANALGESPLDK